MLACGAYESNPAMAQAYEGLPGFLSMFPPTIDGDGMIMDAELGARIRTIRNNLGFSARRGQLVSCQERHLETYPR
jgi:3-oxosteroid 1-dehydrogenase